MIIRCKNDRYIESDRDREEDDTVNIAMNYSKRSICILQVRGSDAVCKLDENSLVRMKKK